MKTALLLLLILLLGACAAPQPAPIAPPTPAPGGLVVDARIERGLISPYIFGTNYGPMHAVPLDMAPLIMDSGFTALRWPGGAWGDDVNLAPFQVDQFVAFYTQMGALPTISVRLDGGTPEAAAKLVRYTNIEKQYGVLYWSIGNEPTLYEQDLGETYDTVRFNREWRAIAEAMKAVDPGIKLMGPELHQWGANLAATLKDSAGRDWMIEFLKANGDLVDVVTVHRYPLWKPGGQPVTFAELRANTEEWDDLVIYLRQVIQEHTGRDLPVAFTEVNSSPTAVLGQEASPDSFPNAIWYADVLGRLIDQHVFMVNQWVISQRSTGLGLINGSTIRPTLYTFHLYKRFGQMQVHAASGVAGVSVYAARREDGALTVMVINLAETEQRPLLQIQGSDPANAEVWLLDRTHNAENLGVQPWPASGELILPPLSATLLVITS